VLEICKLTDEQARAAGSRPGVPVNPKGLTNLRRKAIELIAVVVLDDNWAEFRKPSVECVLEPQPPPPHTHTHTHTVYSRLNSFIGAGTLGSLSVLSCVIW
jgi:hypothetical protein